MSDSNDNNNQTSIPSHSQDSAPPQDSQGMLDNVKNQVNSTGSSLVELGNKTSAMAGESLSDVKNRVGSISPGEVYNNIRGRVQSVTSGDNDSQEDGETTEHRMLILNSVYYGFSL